MRCFNLNKNKKFFWATISCVCVIICLILGAAMYSLLSDFYPSVFKKPKNTIDILNPIIENNNINKNVCSDCVRRIIDGVYSRKGLENFYPIAVIIENHVDARPVFGIEKANLVIETEAEGGITRFLAFFIDGEDISKIGPIRSARPYFVDWARELSALLIHCGGSPEALVKIIKDNVFNINEFYNEKYFWRDQERDAPHNIFTSSEKISEYLEKKEVGEGKFFSWKFKDEALAKEIGSSSGNIEIIFKEPDYIAKWEYNSEENAYFRYGVSEQTIKAKNIIIQYVKTEEIDDEGRLKIENIGEGDSIICADGKREDGTWKKKTSSARTRFYDLDGKEFEFNAGTTWIEVVRPEKKVKIE